MKLCLVTLLCTLALLIEAQPPGGGEGCQLEIVMGCLVQQVPEGGPPGSENVDEGCRLLRCFRDCSEDDVGDFPEPIQQGYQDLQILQCPVRGPGGGGQHESRAAHKRLSEYLKHNRW